LETIAPVPQHPRAGQPILAFQGRLVSTKGIAVLLEATRVLKEERDRPVKLLIIGDGPEREPLERLMRQKGLSNEVRFVGSVPAPQLEQMLSNVWGIVVPSVAGEVFGLVVAENMFRAIPVIASDLGPFVEILDSAGATQLGRRARERAVDYYARSRMIEAHARLYRSVVDR
jgi:glycosyltransferase involved in cell wall biosynthesis